MWQIAGLKNHNVSNGSCSASGSVSKNSKAFLKISIRYLLVNDHLEEEKLSSSY